MADQHMADQPPSPAAAPAAAPAPPSMVEVPPPGAGAGSGVGCSDVEYSTGPHHVDILRNKVGEVVAFIVNRLTPSPGKVCRRFTVVMDARVLGQKSVHCG